MALHTTMWSLQTYDDRSCDAKPELAPFTPSSHTWRLLLVENHQVFNVKNDGGTKISKSLSPTRRRIDVGATLTLTCAVCYSSILCGLYIVWNGDTALPKTPLEHKTDLRPAFPCPTSRHQQHTPPSTAQGWPHLTVRTSPDRLQSCDRGQKGRKASMWIHKLKCEQAVCTPGVSPFSNKICLRHPRP